MVLARAAACTLLMAAMSSAVVAAEADEGGQFSIGVSGGTLGISPEVGYRFGAHTGIRVNGGFLDYDRTEDIDDIEYDGTLKLKSIGALIDLYPFGGSFRLSVGARSSNNEVALLATPTTNQEIGDEEYTPAEIGTLSGGVEFKKFTPTATLGWGGRLGNGFTMGLELGVVYQGSPKLNLTSTGGTLSSNPAFIAELEQERLEAEEDVKDYKLWPVLQLHFLYRF